MSDRQYNIGDALASDVGCLEFELYNMCSHWIQGNSLRLMRYWYMCWCHSPSSPPIWAYVWGKLNRTEIHTDMLVIGKEPFTLNLWTSHGSWDNPSPAGYLAHLHPGPEHQTGVFILCLCLAFPAYLKTRVSKVSPMGLVYPLSAPWPHTLGPTACHIKNEMCTYF